MNQDKKDLKEIINEELQKIIQKEKSKGREFRTEEEALRSANEILNKRIINKHLKTGSPIICYICKRFGGTLRKSDKGYYHLECLP